MKTLPTIDFCGKQVSRLIVGGNPFSGNSHVSPEMDDAMADFFTTQRIKDTLKNCLDNGINTAQMRGDRHIARMMREFRNEGYQMNWIAQNPSELQSFEGSISLLKKYGAYATYLHGTLTDALFKAGEYKEIERRLKVIRNSGMAVGLGAHMPEVFEYAESHKWDVDFYMCCVYNISKIDRVSSAITGKMNAGEPFDEEDRQVMFSFIRSTDKPCLAFKILGATRRCKDKADVEDAFREAFTCIKPSDAVVVGMYPKDHDQVTENADIVRNLIGDK